MKSDFDIGTTLFGGAINVRVNGVLAIRPKFFPGQQFGVLDQQSPKRDEESVSRTLVLPRLANEIIEPGKTLSGPFHINAAHLRRLLVQLAKTRHARGITPPAVLGADSVVERPLPLGAPH